MVESITFKLTLVVSIAVGPPGSDASMFNVCEPNSTALPWKITVALFETEGSIVVDLALDAVLTSEVVIHRIVTAKGTVMSLSTVQAKENSSPLGKSTSIVVGLHDNSTSAMFLVGSNGQWSGRYAPKVLLSPYPSPSESMYCENWSGNSSSMSA